MTVTAQVVDQVDQVAAPVQGHLAGTRPGLAADDFRLIMRRHAASVAVITTDVDGPVGFCATSLASVSLTPPMLSFAVNSRSRCGHAWQRATHGVVHLLHHGQIEVAQQFATAGADKFGGRLRWHLDEAGLPVVEESMARMLVETVSRTGAGDHTLVVVRVLTGERGEHAVPLVYHDGRYVTPAWDHAAR